MQSDSKLNPMLSTASLTSAIVCEHCTSCVVSKLNPESMLVTHAYVSLEPQVPDAVQDVDNAMEGVIGLTAKEESELEEVDASVNCGVD